MRLLLAIHNDPLNRYSTPAAAQATKVACEAAFPTTPFPTVPATPIGSMVWRRVRNHPTRAGYLL